MDAAKTGWRVKPDSYKGDLTLYSHREPKWKEIIGKRKDKSKSGKIDTSNQTYLERDTNSPYAKGDFVMDVLSKAADRKKEKWFIEMDQVFAPLAQGPDPDLTLPWDNLLQWAERGSPDSRRLKRMDLAKIAIHVQKVYRMHSNVLKPNKQQGKGYFTGLPIEDRQDRLRKISTAFVSGPPLEELPTIVDNDLLARCRASYAYKYDAEQQENRAVWSRFPFNVAMRELCDIKARASGIHKVVQNSFYERFKLLDRG